MTRFLAVFMAIPIAVGAQVIFTPGGQSEVIQETTSGYTINSMDGGGATVRDYGGVEIISPYDGSPPTYIYNDDAGMGVIPTVPLTPEGLAIPLRDPSTEYYL